MKTQENIPANFIETKAGIIPANWSHDTVGNIFNFVNTYSYSRNDLTDDSNHGSIKYIHYGDIHSNFDFQIVDFSHYFAFAFLLARNK